MANLRPQQTADISPATETMQPKPKTETKGKTPAPKTEVKEIKPEIKKTAPIQKPKITVPTKEEKMQNVKTLEQKLLKKFQEIDKNPPVTKEAVSTKKWQETTVTAQKPSTNSALSVTASGPNSSDFPFAWYLDNIQNKITSCWTEPQMVLAKKYNAVVSFTLDKNGAVSNIIIKASSNIAEFDQSGLRAIELAKPFPPLPPGYKNPELVINVEFNLQ